MRLDIASESARVAARINSSYRDGIARAVMLRKGTCSVLCVDTRMCLQNMTRWPTRLVGVYTCGVTARQIADDLEELI